MRLKIKEILQSRDPEKLEGKEAMVAGWIRTVRDQKTFVFVAYRDWETDRKSVV